MRLTLQTGVVSIFCTIQPSRRVPRDYAMCSVCNFVQLFYLQIVIVIFVANYKLWTLYTRFVNVVLLQILIFSINYVIGLFMSPPGQIGRRRYHVLNLSVCLSVCPSVCLLPNLWIRDFENESTDFDQIMHKNRLGDKARGRGYVAYVFYSMRIRTYADVFYFSVRKQE